MQLSYQDMYAMNLRSFLNYYRGFHKSKERDWIHTRSIMWAAIQPHIKKRIKPTDFYQMEEERIRIDKEIQQAKIELEAFANGDFFKKLQEEHKRRWQQTQ